MRTQRAIHAEIHHSHRIGWMRAAVLGSNDAIVSTASLMIGVAASNVSAGTILISGIAALVAGATSMAAGEYVSVSSQLDAEQADIKREKYELATSPESELLELAGIYTKRGLDPKLALEVAHQLTAHDPLGAHLRDELGIDSNTLPKPFQAAWISALSFALSALLPILFLVVAPVHYRITVLALSSFGSLLALGALGAYLGGAHIIRGTSRVALGGILAMALSAGIGKLVGRFLGA